VYQNVPRLYVCIHQSFDGILLTHLNSHLCSVKGENMWKHWKLYEAMSILFQEKLQQTSKNLEDKTQTCLLSKSKAANKGVAPCWP